MIPNTVAHEMSFIFVSGTFFVTTITFWITGLAFTFLDFTQKPKFLMKYKVQPGKNEPPDTKKTLKVCLVPWPGCSTWLEELNGLLIH